VPIVTSRRCFGTSFNEAGAFAPEILFMGFPLRASTPCFNEAGAFAPEILHTTLDYGSGAARASMRPGLLPRRYLEGQRGEGWVSRCFNEAGAFAPEILCC